MGLDEAEIEYDDKTLNEVLSLVNELKLNSADLVNEWEAFAYNNKDDKIDTSKINSQSFKIFAKIVRTKSAKISKKSKARSNGMHNRQTLKPLMENIPKPNANAKSMNNQLDSFLAMSTPSEAMPPIQSQNIMQSPAPFNKSSQSTKRRSGER